MKRSITQFLIIVLSVVTLACSNRENYKDQKSKVISASIEKNQFAEYWYAGKAEVSSYTLNQARYGETHEGEAVLIFVTEPFSKSKQVKLDNPQRAGKDNVSVMKLNLVKKFNTGIYPYSMMLSSFTPVDQRHHPNTFKVTMSSQEWCGHVFTQMNLKDDSYHVESYSYFESEEDQKLDIAKSLLEDEIWNMIRINYEALPTGEVQILPGIFSVRLLHKDIKPLKTTATLVKGDRQATYSLQYPNDRLLSIHFSTEFPYTILGWEETYKGLGGKKLTTSAKLKKSLHIDYWNKHNNEHGYLRDSLYLN